jgi:hypothetical protein
VIEMIYMTKSQFDSKIAKAKRRNETIEYRRRLREERRKYWPRFHVPATSKIALWAGFLLMLEVIIFCQYMALKLYDAAPLIAIVGAIGGWMTMFFSYNKKSQAENSRDGIVFETAMAQLNQPSITESTKAVG